MRKLINVLIALTFISCQGQESNKSNVNKESSDELSSVEKYYKENQGNDLPSKSLGTVSKGTLENGKLIPFKGENFRYFDTLSYISGRAFLNENVKQTVLETYKDLERQLPERRFFVMESSNKNGGELFPHRSHQNGLSIDFMMPLIKGNKEYYGLDTIGKDHYWLEFDNNGKYSKDKSVSIDFDLVARHILLLDKYARDHKLKIAKVIIKTELKGKLFATSNGQKLKGSGIYIVNSLTPLINSLHDDHYHIDFEIIK
jgi:penicillin-insensitive murein DD-endopeptidase